MSLEIERKFLVLNDSYKQQSFSHSHIQQGYITSEPGRTVRVRIRDNQAYLTIKGPSLDGGLSRYEFEQEIPLPDGRQLLQLCEPVVIDKTRWLVQSGEHVFEIDEFDGENEGLVMAEVELHTPSDFVIFPDFIGEEVTGDARYYNSRLRHTPYTKWNQDSID